MYDIAILVTGVSDHVLTDEDLARLSFRMSHLDDSFLSWFAVVRMICVIVTACMGMLYFVMKCSTDGFNSKSYTQLNLNQVCIIFLLILCALYDEPFFELRRNSPSESLAVLAEIPASAFFTALLTYWLLSIAHIRVREQKL